MRQWTLIALAIAAVGSSSYAAVSAHSSIQTNCRKIEKLKSYSESAVKRAQVTLPTFAYYKDHPKELAAIKKTLAVELREFQPDSCSVGLLPWG